MTGRWIRGKSIVSDVCDDTKTLGSLFLFMMAQAMNLQSWRSTRSETC